jgi:hypothetical protein
MRCSGNGVVTPMRRVCSHARFALAAARARLTAGHGMVIPQFLGRMTFIEQVEELALADWLRCGDQMRSSRGFGSGTSFLRLLKVCSR